MSFFGNTEGNVVQFEFGEDFVNATYDARKMTPDLLAKSVAGTDHIRSMEPWQDVSGRVRGWACTNAAEGFELRVDQRKTMLLLKYPFQ